MPNPFKRRPSAASSPSNKGAGSIRKNAKGGSIPHGIRIAANSRADASSEGQQQPQSGNQKLDPTNLLPPESDYRTSLIMPHLTKRFTLLRAPDGTMVTPEAMRAHLRAQRARARATGVPGTQCFLTEEEEDEIIDQLRRQTRMEEMEEWEASVQQQQLQQQQQQAHQVQFGGTDGFGSWSTPYQGHQRSDSKVDESITESFSNLRDSTTNSTRSDDQHGATGRLFSSSSSNRDFAYIKEVEKSRAAKRGGDEPSSDQEPSKEENDQKFVPVLQGIQDEESDAEKTSRGESVTPVGGHRIEIESESYDDTPEEEAMPGDFLVASHRESRRLSAPHVDGNVEAVRENNKSLLTPNSAARPQHRNSELLTSLTPEAFNRVSMALEEVYEMVSGRVEESEGEGEEDDLENERSGATLLAYDSESGPSHDDDQLSEERESLEDTRQAKRPSYESETNSFTSARSEVAASAFDGHGTSSRAEALSGIGAAAAFANISPDDRAMSPSAPAGWSVSQPAGINQRTALGDSRRGQPTRHVAGKGSMGSSSAASVISQQSNRQDSPSLRRPLNTPPFDALPSSARSFNGSNSSPLTSSLPPSNGIESAMISPLAAGFHLAGGSTGQTEAETKAASAAAAAAATAAGVAASNYVAQAQQQQRDISSNRASGQMITSDSSATIVPTSEITVAYPQPEPVNSEVLVEEQDEQPVERLSQPSGTTDSANVPVIQSPSRPSAAENQVLSANAIAARSPKYFPTASNRSMQSYATGFRTAAPPTADSVHSSANRSEETDRSQFTPANVNQTSASSSEALNHDQSGKPRPANLEIPPVFSARSPTEADSELSTSHSQTAQSQTSPQKSERFDTSQDQPSVTLSSLSPLPPSDPEEAAKWRKQYGIGKSMDAASIKSGISMQISEDDPLRDERLDEQDDIEDDVWARVARNTSSTLDRNSVAQASNTSDSRIVDNANRSSDIQSNSLSPNSAGVVNSHDALTEKSGLSMDELHKIQNDLVRSANAKQNAEISTQESAAKLEKAREKARMISADRSMNSSGTAPNSPNTSLDTSRRGNENTAKSAENRVRSDEVSGNRSSELTGRNSQPNGQKSSLPFKVPDTRTSSNLQRETSSRSFRSQVMYDVTSSHRPTSPPPRTHKTSLSNLPTLQDLSLGVAPVRSTGGGADRNSTSLISMLETSARVHDQLSATDGQPGSSGIQGAIAEEEGVAEESFEDVAVEDGFGGFTWEKRKRLPRSQSHDVLSSTRMPNSEDAQKETNKPSQFSPKSFRSEPGADREGEANDAGDNSWSRLPGEEPFVNSNLIDDVAAQARAATQALKGENGQRPKMRSKSLGKVRKNLSKAISQPQLVSTTQRMEHTQGLARVDDSLRKKDTNKRPPFPQEMRSSSLTPASSPLVKSTTPILQQQQAQRKVSPQQPSTQKSNATSADRELQAQSPRSPLDTRRLRSGSANTNQSRSISPTDYKASSPTDYKAQTLSARKNSSASGHLRRSSSFGHRGQLDGSISPSTQISPARSASVNAHSTNSPSASSPLGEKGQTGLSRLLTRFRGRKVSDLPALIEPYPSDKQSPTAARSSPALSNMTTPNATSSPVFRTPKESPSQVQLGAGKADTFAGRLAMPNQLGYSSLADMFSPTADGQDPSRNASQNGTVFASQESPVTDPHSPSVQTPALAPAAPIHARLARGSSTVDGAQKPPLPQVESSNMSKTKSARETIVRRTIIVSTYDPGVDDRRKSISARKGSLRKSTLSQSQQQNSTTTTPLQHHRRTSSTASSKARRSIQDRPPTPPGPDGVSGTHRRKLSQEVKSKPLPPTAKNVYEAPTASSSLGVPQSSSRSNAGPASRASNVSGYGASLYDLYDRDDDDDSSLNTGYAQNRSSALAPHDQSVRSSNMIRQASDGTNTGARHIEVTERADGSVVWQVIAGLADRSSVYTASIGYGGGHSRQNSDTSQYSFMRNPPQNGSFGITSPMGKPNALADEDGRSLFARTPTKKSFSIDGDGYVPPLPNMNEVNQPVDTATASQQAQQLDFEMATTTAGQAATRIVYTSDAELAALLESLAGPDKSSAKFAFQRVYEDGNDETVEKDGGENGTESQDTAFASVPSSSSQQQNARSSAQDGSLKSVSAAASPRQSQKSGRPVSIWTESELTNDPTGALRSQRFKIEAEIYSLLQRETAMPSSQPPTENQMSPGENVKSKIAQQTQR